ncbi:MAG: hypothetical protein Kapaf2KO_00110 [Candidatus Kapaibacteriales bacterium]
MTGNEVKIFKELTYEVRPTEGGLSGYCEFIDMYTIGKNFKELRENIRKAINVYYEDVPKRHGDQIILKFKRHDIDSQVQQESYKPKPKPKPKERFA